MELSKLLFNPLLSIIYSGILLLISGVVNGEIPNSPCPQYFQYKFNGNDYFGEIILPSPPIQHREVILHITLSLRAATTNNNVGTIKIAHTPEDATQRIINQQPLTFHVIFPYRYPLPKLVRIIYDNNFLCDGPEEIPSPDTVISRIDLKHVMNTYTNYYPSTAINNNNLYNVDLNANTPAYIPDNNSYETTSTQNNYPFQSQPQQTQRPPIYPSSGSMPPMFSPPFMPPANYPTTATTTTTTTTTTYRPTQLATTNRPDLHATSGDLNDICGTRHSDTTLSPFIYGGDETKRGDWPWMTAIYVNKPTGLSFSCGGTLISSKSVLTAAHCINTPSKNYRAHDIVLYLGRYSLTDWSEIGSIASNVVEIILHSDYKRNGESYDADIAILIMTKQIEFNDFVRPACIWPATTNGIQDVEGKKGTVVGWGKEVNNVVSNTPKKVELPIVNSITCVQTSESLSQAISNRTFCAGTLDGNGPCHGDSGGGLTIFENNRWSLRGIVSTGLADGSGACKLTDYVVFTDVSFFSIWISTYL